MVVHTAIHVDVVTDAAEIRRVGYDQAFVRITFPNGHVENISVHLAEMIGLDQVWRDLVKLKGADEGAGHKIH